MESDKRFQVAISYTSDYQQFVGEVAELLSQVLGRQRVLYDKFHEAEFARPNLDTHLQALYHDQSQLVVVFLCANYERKEWPHLEWRAIRDLIKKRQDASIMPIHMDDTCISGLLSIDGYINAQRREPADVAKLIMERLQSLGMKSDLPVMSSNVTISASSRKQKPTLIELRKELQHTLMGSGIEGNSLEQSLHQITGRFQGFLIDAINEAEKGHPLSLDLNETSDILSQLTRAYSEALVLRLDLAKLRDAHGDYHGGLEDLQLLVSSSALPRSNDLHAAAVLLLSLSEYSEAKRLFYVLENALVEKNSSLMWIPLDENERLMQFFSSKQFSALWIPDYEGYYDNVLREADHLLQLSSQFGRLHEAGVMHRLGRSTLMRGKQLARNDMIKRGSEILDRARKLAGRDANPYHDLWMYVAAEALKNSNNDYYWDRVLEVTKDWGKGIDAHRFFLEGRKHRIEGKLFAAIEPLNQALTIWKSLPYPKGACDVLCELGLTYSGLGTTQSDHLIAACYFRAAEIIAGGRHFPILQQVIMWRKMCCARGALTTNSLEAFVEGLQESSPKLFKRYSFSIPGMHELTSLDLP